MPKKRAKRQIVKKGNANEVSNTNYQVIIKTEAVADKFCNLAGLKKAILTHRRSKFIIAVSMETDPEVIVDIVEPTYLRLRDAVDVNGNIKNTVVLVDKLMIDNWSGRDKLKLPEKSEMYIIGHGSVNLCGNDRICGADLAKMFSTFISSTECQIIKLFSCSSADKFDKDEVEKTNLFDKSKKEKIINNYSSSLVQNFSENCPQGLVVYGYTGALGETKDKVTGRMHSTSGDSSRKEVRARYAKIAYRDGMFLKSYCYLTERPTIQLTVDDKVHSMKLSSLPS